MMKYKKNTYKTWMAALLLGMATLPSCEQESLVTSFEEAAPNTLSLKLFCSESNESRSADDTNNEDAIHRLDIFLYPDGAYFNTQAVYQKTINNLSSNESHTVSLDLTNKNIKDLFGESGTTCKIYVIANRPDGTAWESGKTSVKQLKALTITAAFNSFNTVNGISVYQPQADFVMDSDFNIDGSNDIVTLDRNNHTLSGTVPLYRAASKISLVITQVKDVPMTDEDGNPVYVKDADGNIVYEKDENGQVIEDEDGNPIPVRIMWQANTKGMLVRLHDGVYKTHIDNSVQPYTVLKKTETANGDYFSFTSGQEVKMTAVGSVWMNTPAFYSYSSNWGKADNPDEEPYLTLIVPWARSDEKNADGSPYYQRTYYQVPISTIAKSLARNTHYKINLVVSRLGSFVEEVPEALNPSSYIIVPWQSETVNANLMDYRYLMVEEKGITIYNENELYIPYVTSHEAEIVSVSFAKQNITGALPTWTPINSNSNDYLSNLELVETNGVKQIYYKNVLDNVYTSPTFDFTPYKVTFTIQHHDDSKYKEEVTIIQYPAIYGEASQNSDYSNDNNTNGNHGYTFVNGYYSDSNGENETSRGLGNQDYFNSVPGLVNSGASPNMYVFTVTSVYGTDYVIGDPRENSISTIVDAKRTYYNTSNTATAWVQAPALYDNASNRGLEYYYGTDVDYTSNTTMQNSRTKDIIAPKFRIASAYGVLHTGDGASESVEGMRKRCASYQEDGYPAGRWRLPTEAEFRFIISQVDKGTLPELYIEGYTYWCAHGLGTPDGNGKINMSYVKTSNGNSTRCVYDEWYWGSEQLENKSQFTWGDQPR